MRLAGCVLTVLAVLFGTAACSDAGKLDQTFPNLTRQSATPSAEATGSACANPAGCHARPRRVGRFDQALAPEASGLARSRRNAGVLWLVDDAPGTHELIAVRIDGALLATVRVQGMEDSVNIEALASGPCGSSAQRRQEHCLYVGDIGDNVAARTDVRIYRVTEPDLSAGAPGEPLPADVIALRYPGGPRDAEALLVDEQGVPFLLDKAGFDVVTGVTQPTRLYAAPGFRSGPLLQVAELALPEPGTALATLLYGNVVTGADSAAGKVLLRTYDQAVEFLAPGPGADLATLPQWRTRAVPAPWQPQAEAVAYAADGCGYFLVSEKSGDIWSVPCA